MKLLTTLRRIELILLRNSMLGVDTKQSHSNYEYVQALRLSLEAGDISRATEAQKIVRAHSETARMIEGLRAELMNF